MITGSILRDAIISGANAIKNERASVDELNVFPVPDGDTGTNMSMTIGNALQELGALPDECGVDKASAVAATAMLRGARGNSGVILSLLFRGFSKALVGKNTADADDLRAALSGGVKAAYKAVMKPTEGTMLTVARVASEKAEESAIADPVELFSLILKEANVALEHTPEQLPVLKKAGVVDAGGKGLTIIFAGMLQVLEGRGKIEPEEKPAQEPRLSTSKMGKGVFNAELNPDITNGYCTQFLINKNPRFSAEKLRAFLESNGDSVVMIEDDQVANCHVHTNDPGKIITHALLYGYLTQFKIENMHEQWEQRQSEAKGLEKQAADEKNPAKGSFPYAAVDTAVKYGFVAVAAGSGLGDVFHDLGVTAVVSGGQTMNPSTDDILRAIHSVSAETVFVLPNNKNIIMAAEQAAKLADRRTIVLPTTTVPQGMSAMLGFDEEASAKENTVNMNAAAKKVATGSITFAARNSDFDGHKIKKDEILALENGKIAFTEKELEKALVRLTRSMVKKDSSFVTLISGSDVPEEDAEKALAAVIAKLPSDVEVTHIHGGQPVYYYIVSVE